MKWQLLHTPQWAMNVFINVFTILPSKLRVKIFLFLAPSMYKMTDQELDFFMDRMTKSLFSLKAGWQRYRFAETRLGSFPAIPEKEAVRLVHYMAKTCQEGSLEEYTKEQAMMQRAILTAPQKQREVAKKILTKAGVTGSLPIEIKEIKEVKKNGQNKKDTSS